MSGTDNSKNVIDLFNSLCSGNADLDEIIMAIQNYDEITIDKLLLNKVISIIDQNTQKKDFWESLIPYLSSDSFNDNSLAYFFQNDLGSIAMCHKQLSDEWLLKYSAFDDEPLFILADRYRSDDCSKSKFINFIETYVIKHANLYEYIVENYPYGEKWKLTVILGAKCCDSTIRKTANDQLECFTISNTHDIERIKEAYENHKSDAQWLLGIAGNPATPLDILHEMAGISGVKFAKKIRILSSEMIALIANSQLLRNN